MIGDQAAAEEEVRRGLRRDPSSTGMWEVAALLGRHYGTDDGRLERVADATRGQSAAGSIPAAVADLRHRHLPRLPRGRAGDRRGAPGA